MSGPTLAAVLAEHDGWQQELAANGTRAPLYCACDQMICEDAMGHQDPRVPWAEHVAVLASDWLAAHDAQVRREHGERIAQAIEAELVCCDGEDRHGGGICYWGSRAARIARQEQGS